MAARRAPRASLTLPRQKREVYTDMKERISLRASGFKEEAECCAQVVQASETQVTPAPIGANYLKEKVTLYRGCHALCTSDAPFVRTSLIPLTSQLVLARLMSGLYFLRGAKGGRPCLLFVLALYLAGSPRKPPYACSGSHGLTVVYLVAKLIRLYRVIAT